MSIRVGTIATRWESRDNGYNGYKPCIEFNYHPEEDNSDYHLELGVCVGMVIDTLTLAVPTQRTVLVHWVQICKYHQKLRTPAQEVLDPDKLWEVGQLI